VTAVPPASAWDMALNGIRQLGTKLDGVVETQRQLQEQLNDVRSAYTRAAPMSAFMQLEGRVASLESGATAAILRHLDEDRAAGSAWRDEERVDRAVGRAASARREWLLLALLAGLLLAVLSLVGVLIWLGVR
jgi:hypothetical protein